MTGLDMLDIAIGVTFVFLLLSLICSTINEIIEALLKKRAQYLELSIRLLVISVMRDTDNKKLEKILKGIYGHPLINGLFNGDYEFEPSLSKDNKVKFPFLSTIRYGSKTRKLPSYIPSRNFSQAFLDVIKKPPQQSNGTKNQPPRDSKEKSAYNDYFDPEKVKKITLLTPEVFANAPDRIETYFRRELIAFAAEKVPNSSPVLKEKITALINKSAYYEVIGDIKDEIEKFALDPNEKASFDKAALIKALDDFNVGIEPQFRIFLNRVNSSYESARKDFEDWYNSSMDRVAGWYKRRSQIISLSLGFLVAFYLNVDAINIVQSLKNDSTLRAAVAARAQEYAKAHAETMKSPSPTPIATTSPATSEGKPQKPAETVPSSGNSNKSNTGTGNNNTTNTSNTSATTETDNINATVIKAAFFQTPSPTPTATPNATASLTPTVKPSVMPSPSIQTQPTSNQPPCDKNPNSDECKKQIKECKKDNTKEACQTILACYGEDKSEAGCSACKKDPKSRQCMFTECWDTPNSPECRLVDSLTEIKSLGFPIGWNNDDPRTRYPVGWGWLYKIIGLLITGIAVSLGAPFWFDILNKFMVVRSTVKPTEKSPEEDSEDRQAKPGKK